MNLMRELMVKPGARVKLSDHDPESTPGFRNKEEAVEALEKSIARLGELQFLLYAEDKRSLLVVLQAMDAAGKDGTVRKVMSGLNPQGCEVTSFKAPSTEERDHDFLWRIHKAVPRKGEIGIFNRSHYEDVLIVRVHELVPKPVWSKRYAQINTFEKNLSENGVKILKIFLHISKAEQKKRLEARLKDPTRNWKFDPGDLKERKCWDDYMKAYEDAMEECSTEHAPWFIIPANKKWYRNIAVSRIIHEALEEMDMKFPKPAFDLSKIVVD